MKSFGRRHRPFFRICAMDSRAPRDGRAIEELGWYDPMVKNVDAREWLDVSRIRYWLSVGAQPSDKVAAILKRHGVKKPEPNEGWKVEQAPSPASRPAGLAKRS
jgi:small subunit ribosomal protein S16